MNAPLLDITPGDLVYARGREWVALPSPRPEWLALRPLTGSESDLQLLHPALEVDPVRHAQFAPPTPDQVATQEAAQLLSDALRLSLRRGAGPFRATAQLAFEPRAYQLVPLLMALRLPVVRLLIADDVGIGKTVEAGLILRELKDRGEVDRFTVLCPPHLVEQWTEELRQKFDVDAVAVTSASAARLERTLVGSQSLFDAYPHTVVSLDFMKADKRRENFARSCPEFVIVDEAHTCVGTNKGRQQRFELLRHLAADAQRHLVLLTATPHSGDEEAFDRLLGLLDPAFHTRHMDDEAFRVRLARHFVQRGRKDVAEEPAWNESRTFPRHERGECPYTLDGAHKAFHDAVLDYCLSVVEGAGNQERSQRLAFWGTLALMRCVGSSPRAALNALRNRLGVGDAEGLADQIFDEDAPETEATDVEPTAGLAHPEQDDTLRQLITQAEQLVTAKDPKLEATIKELKPLIAQGANPVVFCRYLATADYVADGLRRAFPKLRVDVVTGELTPEDRRTRVETLGDTEQRLLVATDCLSEGINLQSLFDTIVHYDLSWNPTRHQQREGRVDRFGQPAPLVRSLMLYSPDSAIDGAVLEVILRKAEAIRKATGVTVTLPEERGAVTGALMNAVLLRRGRTEQLALALNLAPAAAALETRWRDAEEDERKSRTRFAQRALKPQEVMPEWQRWREVLGTPEELQRFVSRAMARLGTGLEAQKTLWLAHLDRLPPALRERLEGRQLTNTVPITFNPQAPAPQAQLVTRNHPLTATLAETLLEGALDPTNTTLPVLARLGRVGAWRTEAVAKKTTVVLLRLRFKLHLQGKQERLLLVEEAQALAFEGAAPTPHATGDDARALLEALAADNVPDTVRDRLIQDALAQLTDTTPWGDAITAFAAQRAQQLQTDHQRVRDTLSPKSRGSVSATPVLPADVVGVFVLTPPVTAI